MIFKISKLKIIEIRQRNAFSITTGMFFIYYIANLNCPGIPGKSPECFGNSRSREIEIVREIPNPNQFVIEFTVVPFCLHPVSNCPRSSLQRSSEFATWLPSEFPMSNGSLHVTMTILVFHLFKLQSFASRLPFFIALHPSQNRHGAIH